MAFFYIARADDAFARGASLGVKKGVSPEQRLKHYRRACADFTTAFQMDRSVFTLNRILSATEACARVENYQAEAQFAEFADLYAKEHPDEVEYGDAGVFMGLDV